MKRTENPAAHEEMLLLPGLVLQESMLSFFKDGNQGDAVLLRSGNGLLFTVYNM